MKMQEATELMAAFGAKKEHIGSTVLLTWEDGEPTIRVGAYTECESWIYGKNIMLDLTVELIQSRMCIHGTGAFINIEVD